jgi:surface protein
METNATSPVPTRPIPTERVIDKMRKLKSINTSNFKDVLKVYMYDKTILPEEFRNISKWDTSKVTDMSDLFKNYPDFNENINEWKVTKVIFMQRMFAGCTEFDQPLDTWRMPLCITMFKMFTNCKKFKQNINDWDVSGVIHMTTMFENCEEFNSPLDKWNLRSIESTRYMFQNCISFNQPLNNWDQYLSNCNTDNMFLGCGISEENKPASLSNQPQGPHLTINELFENQGITTYQNVQPVHLVDSHDASVIIESTTTVDDPITMDSVNVYDYLKEDDDNIVIVYLKNLHLVSKSRLRTLCSDISAVKYNCHAVGRINFDRTTPYLTGRSFGCLCGLIEMSKIKTIIETPEIRVVQILDFIPEKNALSTISQSALLVYLKQNAAQLSNEEREIVNASDWVSVSHCQAGQEEKIRDIQKLPTPVFSTGGKIKRRNTVKKTKKIIKRIIKKKTKNNKKNYK